MEQLKKCCYSLRNVCSKYIKYDKAILYFLVLFIHFIIIFTYNAVIAMYPDELNVLALPSYLTGNTTSDGLSKLYHGWEMGILYLPFFLLRFDGLLLYKSMLILNAVIVSFIPVISYTILKKFFGYKNRMGLFFISVIAGIAPETLFMSKYVWNETLVMFFTWFILYLVLAVINETNKNKKICLSVLLGLSCSFSCGSHGRMLAMLASVIIILLLYTVMYKKKPVNIAGFAVGFLFFYIIDFFVKRFVITNILTANVTENSPLRNTTEDVLSYIPEIFSSPQSFIGNLCALINDTFYDLFATYGIIVFGIIILFKLMKKIKTFDNPENKNEFIALLYGYLFLIFLIFLTVIFFCDTYINTTDKGYFRIFGRYTENAAIMCMIFSLYYAIRYGMSKNGFIISTVVTALFFAAFYFIEADALTGHGVIIDPYQIFTLYCGPLNTDAIFASKKVLYTILMQIWAGGGFIMFLFSKNKKAVPLLLLILLILIPVHTGYLRISVVSNDLFNGIRKTYYFFRNDNVYDNNKIYFYTYDHGAINTLFRNFNVQIIDKIESDETDENGNKISYPDDVKIEKNSFIVTGTIVSPDFNCNKNELYYIILDENDETLILDKNPFFSTTTEKIFIYGSELAEKIRSKGYKISNDLSGFINS